MSVPIYPIVVDSSTYTPDLEETIKYSLFQVLFNSGLLKGLTDKGRNYDAIGKDSNCIWSEAFFYFDLIEYMTLCSLDMRQNALECGSEDFVVQFNSYNMDCIKKTLLCRYGNSGVVDSLKNQLIETFVLRLDLCCEEGNGGISIMNINNPSCNTFTVYPAV